MEVNIQHPRKQSGEELKPRTAWNRHPLITPIRVYWEIPLSAPQPLVSGIETLGLGGIETQGIETPVGTPGRVESNPLWGSGIETQRV